jgi:exonuclease III
LAISTDLDGDIFPDAAIDNVTFLFAQCDQIPMIPIEIEKESNRFIRVTSWNCLQDNIANSSLTNIFQRILKVINPDIIAFQELYDTDEKFVKSTLQTALPGSDWYVLKQAFTDIVLASRYPIESSHQINGNSAFIVNLGGNTQLRSLIINTHLPASQDNDKRLGEIKNIINFVRNAKTNPVQYNLKKDFPVFIVGDMNLVGYSEQLKLLMTGSIDGNIKDIDWDNSEFNEANPRATEIPFCYTWTKSFSSFWPGKLDYIIFSDFSAELKKSFSINTNKMSNQNIQKYNLNSDDSHKATDHLPIVADFEIKNWNDIKEYHSNFLIFNSFSRLLENNSYISYIIEIYNLLGMKILESDIQPYSQVNLQFLPKGVFYITARTENYNSKPIIIRVCNLE